MRRVILHLIIACCTFAGSVYLSKVWNWMRYEEISSEMPQVYEADWSVAPPEAGLIEIYRDYALAQTNHDVAFFERVESDDFKLFLADGRALSRTEDIQLLNSFPTDIVYKHEDVTMEIYGNAAIVTGRIRANYGKGYSSSWRWIDVCVKRAGRWQIQSTTQVD